MVPSSLNQKIVNYMIQAQEEELKRIATELHEGVAQTLYSLNIGLKLIEDGIDNGIELQALKRYTSDMMKSAERTLEEIRWLSTELYPSSLHDLGLMPALKTYLEIYTSTFGVAVHLKSQGKERKLPSAVEVSLFRACQETLHNAAKYADANEVYIELEWTDIQLLMTIEDFGIGFDVEKTLLNNELLGIVAMKQRMELVDGTFSISSVIGKGTKVVLYAPVKDRSAEG
jgi:signal transduction histidine kinase